MDLPNSCWDEEMSADLETNLGETMQAPPSSIKLCSIDLPAQGGAGRGDPDQVSGSIVLKTTHNDQWQRDDASWRLRMQLSLSLAGTCRISVRDSYAASSNLGTPN